jgi:hypothetical protein
MAAISNPGFSHLARILAGPGAVLGSPTLASPTTESNLQNGPTSVTQLSNPALQLQAVAGLFGSGVSSLDQSLSSSASSLLDSLSANSTVSSGNSGSPQTGSNSSSNSSPPADQLAAYEAQLQMQQTQALFGIDPTATSKTGILNLLA